MSNSYIIVDDPKEPKRYWGGPDLGWIGSRDAARTYNQQSRDYGNLPAGGVWLLNEENQADYDIPHAPVPYENPKEFQGKLCKVCDWELDYEPVHGKAEKSTVPIQDSDETLSQVKSFRVTWYSVFAAYKVSIPNWEGGEVVHRSDYDALLSQRGSLVEALKNLQAWMEFLLKHKIRSRAGEIPPTCTDGYSYIDVPEWDMRQKLAAIKEDLSDVKEKETKGLGEGGTELGSQRARFLKTER